MKTSSTLRWSLLALIILGGIAWAATGNAIFIRMAYLGLVLLVGAGLWSAFLARGIRVRRDARLLRAGVGEVFEERFEVGVSTWPGCPWLEVVNQSTLPGAAGSRLLTRIGRREKRFYAARTLLTRRGAYPLGPTLISAGDPFGLFPVEKHIPAADTLVVLPMAFPISEFPPPPGILPGGKTIRTKTADVTPHAAGVREYVPGDPMKRIHWPSTARRGRFMVKEFEQDPQAEIWLFVDGQSNVHIRKEDEQLPLIDEKLLLRRPKVNLPCDTFEYAMSAAGSLAQHFLRNRRSVGLACSSAKFTVLSSERGERQVGKLLETLSFLQPDGGIPVLGLVTMQAKLLPLGTGVILITPSTNPELLLAVEDLQRRNLRPVVVLLKAATFGGESGDSDAIASTLLAMSVPVCPVGYGDDLGAHLSLPAFYFQGRYYPKYYFTTRA
ncbi:MAG: DUF58 domain-containing protein [Chloroflexi bacterium]|nr:DUF58 domain-containing protein [Chloroflexota bacterium]